MCPPYTSFPFQKNIKSHLPPSTIHPNAVSKQKKHHPHIKYTGINFAIVKIFTYVQDKEKCWSEQLPFIKSFKNSVKHPSMVSDIFLFLPDAIHKKTKKICWQLKNYDLPKRCDMQEGSKGYFCLASMVKNAAWGPGSEVVVVTLQDFKRPDRTAGSWRSKQQPLLLFGVGIGHEIWWVQAHTSAISGGGGPSSSLYVLLYRSHVLNSRPAAPTWPAVSF